MSDDRPLVVPEDDAPSIVPGDEVEPSEPPAGDAPQANPPAAGKILRERGRESRSNGSRDEESKYKDVPEPGEGRGAGYNDDPETEAGETDGRSMPDVVNAAAWCADPPPLEPAIIEGLLRKGAKMVLGGCSKSRKSWTLIQLALCIGDGRQFLGMPTRKSKVLYINLELSKAEMCARVADIAKALRCDKDNLYVWNLRGHAASLEQLLESIVHRAKTHDIETIILDPIYKVLGNRCENANEAVADLLNHVDDIAESTGAAFIFAHHFAKGSQGGKFVEDRISGAGAWWRDPDAGIFMTPLEDEGGFNITCMARSFPPRDEFAARASHPLMVVADDLDPGNIRQPGPSKKVTVKQLVELLPDNGAVYSEWKAVADTKFKVSESTFNRRRKEAENAGLIKQEGGRYFPIDPDST